MRGKLMKMTGLAAALLAAVLLLLPESALARVYIDINSPGLKRLPIAVVDFAGVAEGTELADIIRSDLDFTGLFVFINKSAFIEGATAPFSPENWRPLGIDAVVKGTIEAEADGSLGVVTSVYDVVESSNILKKKYSTRKDLIRPLAHKIADDIYEALTGQKSYFSSRIVFIGGDGDKKSLYMMDYDGQRMKKIVSRGDITMKGHWSQDGKKLFYSSLRNGKWGIYGLDFDQVSEERLYSSGATDLVGDIMPDGGSLLISSSVKGSPNIYRLHLGTKEVTRLTHSENIDVSPSVSPDGKSVVYVSDKSTVPQLYIMAIDGSSSRRLTFQGNYNTTPEWSRAGDLIVFSGREGGRFQIFTIKPDGTELKQLTDAGTNEEPSFSPDGRMIAFTSDRDGTKGVYVMTASGDGQKRISPRDIRAFGPSWSH
ncbi:MAG: Tol-Pal system beta propeller repeat protein TolB [Candidatus Magnetominusculus sp. LBB02]|nr:Tol-Pal system beta propeller repeat protein TolB [Candidatus Magnetominusculus sp. LBB02]